MNQDAPSPRRARAVEYATLTLQDQPHYAEQIDALSQQVWARFLLNGDVSNWQRLFDTFPEYQLLLQDTDGELLAVGHTVPLVWDGTVPDLPESIEAIIQRAEQMRAAGQTPNTVSALAAMVGPQQQGRGLSSEVVRQMANLAARHGCSSLIAPVRPTMKDRYPLIPLEDYLQWTTPDGESFDPWIRVHVRLGAEVLAVANNTMTVESSIADWVKWTGLRFPGSGHYLVPGALQPVTIDLEQGTGRYEDPNVWMRHPIHPEVS